MKNNSKIEAIIACVNYSDFLKITLEKNLKQFDNIIVITSESDLLTQELCKKLNCELLVTDVFYANDKKFNRGAAINLAFNILKYKDWIVNMDADILLPENFINQFKEENMDREYFYGSRRVDFPTPKDWNDFNSGIRDISEYVCYRGSGYGYFQLFNYNSSTFQELNRRTSRNPYPNWLNSVAEADSIYKNYWGDRVCPLNHGNHSIDVGDYDVGLYKELSQRCYHLGQHGINHTGRISEEFKL